MTGLLFVTAPDADFKIINRALLYMRDWEYESGDSFKLVNTRNAYDLDPPEDSHRMTEATSPPIAENITNAWSGSSVEEIEPYVMELKRADLKGCSTSLYVVIDEQGVRDKTCILGEHIIDDRERRRDMSPDERMESLKDTGQFNKVRVPWDEVYLMWCNLDIANMSFEDFCDGLRDSDADPYADESLRFQGKWWKYKSVADGPDLSEENIILRDGEIMELENSGQA